MRVVTAPVWGQSKRCWRSSGVVAQGLEELIKGGLMGGSGMLGDVCFVCGTVSSVSIGIWGEVRDRGGGVSRAASQAYRTSL